MCQQFLLEMHVSLGLCLDHPPVPASRPHGELPMSTPHLIAKGCLEPSRHQHFSPQSVAVRVTPFLRVLLP